MTLVTALRHAKRDRDPADPYEVEYAKQLNAEGRAQARAMRILLGLPTFDLVLSSDAYRAWETGKIVAAQRRVLTVPALGYEYASKRGKLLERLFKNHPHDTTLEEYYQTPEGAALKEHGRIAWRTMLSYIVGAKPRTMLVVGHGGTLPAMMECALTKEEERAICLRQIAPQCGGYRFTLEDGVVSNLELVGVLCY
jgi:broad specificity phosphatase PhoE